MALVDPQPGLPDMVFTANAGLERNGTVLLSSFYHPERRGEEHYFALDSFVRLYGRPSSARNTLSKAKETPYFPAMARVCGSLMAFAVRRRVIHVLPRRGT